MSYTVVCWHDGKGNNFTADTLFDPKTGIYVDWDNQRAIWVRRVTDKPTIIQG